MRIKGHLKKCIAAQAVYLELLGEILNLKNSNEPIYIYIYIHMLLGREVYALH